MWPGEHEELTVWADRLLADGDPLGQLVALGLRVEELRDSAADPTDADSLFEELTDLIERNGEALLGPLASEPALELEWQCGVVREAFPSFPVEAAPLLLPLLAINVDGHRIFGDLAQRAVAHAATRPAWVHAVAQNSRKREPWVARWLASIKALAC